MLVEAFSIVYFRHSNYVMYLLVIRGEAKITLGFDDQINGLVWNQILTLIMSIGL